MTGPDFLIDSYDFPLPAQRIAQRAKPRGQSKLLVVDERGRLHHRIFKDIVEFLGPDHILILNDTKVVPGRLLCRKETGAKIELVADGPPDPTEFTCVAKPAKRLKPGTRLSVGPAILEVLWRKDARVRLRVIQGPDVMQLLMTHGQTPLPPYIKRQVEPEDAERYQTVYAKKEGSTAAPTAGLHFTRDIISRLEDKGVQVLKITLHVGLGTFAPVRVQDIRQHEMSSEMYTIPDQTAEAIIQAKRSGKKVVATGTTATRALESWALDQKERQAWTDLFIYPGHEFKVVDTLITNFHMPKATPVILTSAFIGRKRLLRVYQRAIEMDYAFGSYGDAMLLLSKLPDIP